MRGTPSTTTLRLLPYHARLAARSLRRNPVMTILMFLSLAFGAGTWSVAVTQYVRFHGLGQGLSPALHHVEVLRPLDEDVAIVEQRGAEAQLSPTILLSRSLLTLAELHRLGHPDVPVRHATGIRAEVVVQEAGGRTSARVARFTNADFFALFDRTFRAGGPWPAGDDDRGADVVVLGKALAEELFPRGDAVGQTLGVDGQVLRVVGVLARHQPLEAPWQFLANGGLQDALFLPFGQFERLQALPYQASVRTPPPGPNRAGYLAAGVFVSYWVELPGPAQRAAYARYVERAFGPGGAVLRALPEWRRSFALAASPITFFNFIGIVVLLGGTFGLGRWLMTKGALRTAELGVYRALGAPRSSLFWRVMVEAAMVSLPAALSAPLVAAPMIWFFNQHVHVVDIPLEHSLPSVLFTVGAPLAFNLLGALYPASRLAFTSPTLYLASST